MRKVRVIKLENQIIAVNKKLISFLYQIILNKKKYIFYFIIPPQKSFNGCFSLVRLSYRVFITHTRCLNDFIDVR